jgi:peptidoglycan hydrolase-like protein with peptidoglycan-binding domain
MSERYIMNWLYGGAFIAVSCGLLAYHSPEPLQPMSSSASLDVAQAAPANVPTRQSVEQAILDGRLELISNRAGAAQPPALNSRAPDKSHENLVQAAQTELKRLGCYPARVDGKWGPSTRRAVKKFNRAFSANHNSSFPAPELLIALRAADTKTCKPEANRETALPSAPAPKKQSAVVQTAAASSANGYLPPWVKPGQQTGASDTVAVAAPAVLKPRPRKVVKAPTPKVAGVRSRFSAASFNFPWPGQ